MNNMLARLWHMGKKKKEIKELQPTAVGVEVVHRTIVQKMLPMYPDGLDRAETGPMRFGTDFPGLFIRNDHAQVWAGHLARVVEDDQFELDPFLWGVLMGLLEALRSCDVRRISEKGNVPEE